MKVLMLSCLLLVAAVHAQNYRKCQDKDPFSCGITCGPNEVHNCVNDYCTCVRGMHCLTVDDCLFRCYKSDQHMHCLDGECHCLKMDEMDGGDK